MKKLLLPILLFIINANSAIAQCSAGSITGLHSVALGDTTRLHDTASGGTWVSSDTAIAAINPATGLVRGKTQGRVTISYTLSGSCSGHFTTDTITVASGSTIHSKVCIGDTTTARHYISGGTWSSNNPSIATINSTSGLIHGISAGSVMISYNYTVAGTGYTATNAFRVAAVPSIGTITGPHVFCVYDTATLAYATANGNWEVGDTNVVYISPIDSNRGFATALNAGTTYVKYTSDFCSFVYDSVNFMVRANPYPGMVTGPTTPICRGVPTALTLTGGPGGGTWTSVSPDDTISSTGVVTLSGRSGGWIPFDYTVTDSFGCSGSTGWYLLSVLSAFSAPVLGPNDIQLGVPTIYTNAGYYGGLSSSWALTSTAVASGTTSSSTDYTVTGITVGTDTIRNIISGACDSDVAFKTINVLPPTIGAMSTLFSSFINRNCGHPDFGVTLPAHTASYILRNNYGDGYSDTLTITPASTGSVRTFSHLYAASGTYSIKQVLYSGAVPLDSVVYTYPHFNCNDISLSFYYDFNSNCSFDSASEWMNRTPILVEVDSASIPIDTLSITGGVYYRAWGAPGTVYAFKLSSLDSIASISCPTSGVIYDTIGSGRYDTSNNNIAITCSSVSGSTFDLAASSVQRAGRHMSFGSINVSNLRCMPKNAIVTLNISPKYIVDTTMFSYCSSLSGYTPHSLTWNLTGVSALFPPSILNYEVNLSGTTWLVPGDTVHTKITVSPSVGDADSSNNVIDRVDTVTSSFDPNFISVVPEGNILNGTKLHYAIEFENDGNDTAENIFILDTLSNNLNIHTLRITSVSAAMSIAFLTGGGHNIVKFEFPNIKLPDSSHHNHCTGMVTFNVDAYTGIADGTAISNRAGIYFDDNPVVMTNSVNNTIVIPSISIGTASSVSCIGDTVRFLATPHSVSNRHFQWFVNSAASGTDASGFATNALSTGDVVKCILTSIQDDTIYTNSNNITMSAVVPAPVAGSISGPDSVCVGSSVSVASSGTSGGTWSAANSHVTVATGVVNGISAGIDTIIYTVTNACGSARTRSRITINNTVSPSVTIAESPGDSVCSGDSVTFTPSVVNAGSTPHFLWEKFGIIIDSGVTLKYPPANGDAIKCILISSAICPAPDSVSSAIKTMVVTPTVTPTATISLTTNDSVAYFGQPVTLYSEISFCGSSPTYQWYRNGLAVPGATSSSFLTDVYSNDTFYCSISCSTPCATSLSSNSNTIVVYADYLALLVKEFEINGNAFTMFPNPNNGHFTISGKLTKMVDDPMPYEVVDMLGKVVYKDSMIPHGGRVQESINMEGSMAAGQYILKIYGSGNVSLLHFVIDK